MLNISSEALILSVDVVVVPKLKKDEYESELCLLTTRLIFLQFHSKMIAREVIDLLDLSNILIRCDFP